LREKFFTWEQSVYEEELLVACPELLSFAEVNKHYMSLFHNLDFVYLRHPKFWNTEESALSAKERSRNRSRKNSVSQAEINYSRRGSLDSDSSAMKSKKSNRSYMSKKRLLQKKHEEESALQALRAKRAKRQQEEEEFGWSKHVQQLQHMADVCEDYNFMVDSLEDEHQRRSVHTMKEYDLD